MEAHNLSSSPPRLIHFDVQGFSQTYWHLFLAPGFSVGVFYVFAAVLAWQLGGLPAETLAVMRITVSLCGLFALPPSGSPGSAPMFTGFEGLQDTLNLDWESDGFDLVRIADHSKVIRHAVRWRRILRFAASNS
jgi:hypothetical protein